MTNRFLLMLLAVFLAWASSASAGEERDYTIRYTDAQFEDVFLDLQDAVINQGLVIDYVGHVNTMLERTADAASDAADKSPYLNARYLQFCSAAITHEAIRIRPQNLATCPFVIFVYQTRDEPERVAIGYRNPEMGVPGPTRFVMEKATILLDKIIAETLS